MVTIKDYEDAEGWLYDHEEVVPEDVISVDRWTTSFRKVVKDADGSYWEITWVTGSTEYQDLPFEEQEWKVKRVFPHTKTVTIYK